MLKRLLTAFGLGLMLALGGCSSSSPIKSTYDYNRQVDFSGYRTYAFISENPMSVSQAQGAVNPMLEGRLMESIPDRHEQQGLQRSPGRGIGGHGHRFHRRIP